MSNKAKDFAVAVLFCLFIVGGCVVCLLNPPNAHSDTERRTLAQFPKITWDAVLDTSWMQDFEDYTLDQFPLRDTFRRLKAFTHYYIFAQKDNNDIYIAGDVVSKLDFPLREDNVLHAANRFEDMYEKFFKDTDANMYYAVIPDKNYFMAEENGYPALDYDRLLAIMKENMTDFSYIDIFGQLSLGDYYRTDTHWKQESLFGVADTLAGAMGVGDSLNKEFTAVTHTPFYGVYYGQAALPLPPDTLTYLTSDVLDGCTVTNFETGKTGPVYDLSKLTSQDPYEMYLSGPISLLTIENPAAETERELVIFRDSFGSSIAPLLVPAYSKITLVDIRYILPDYIERFVDLTTADDVLFLYSTLVLNSSKDTLK